MSAGGTISLVARASDGDNLKDVWIVYFKLDDPRALADTGAQGDPHEWAVDLARKTETPPCAAGDRIIVSTTGKRNVTIVRADRTTAIIKSEVPGTYDPARRIN